ncbi:efflux transporter outer membrane subunit [Pseudaquabacterium rugosum]|uniref:Efflux transporter outer membrane subunit n=1 Tax=Pseudaquabacterium rugosum TaxID=2984194 RepID=A0ABU9B9C9_9BURK
MLAALLLSGCAASPLGPPAARADASAPALDLPARWSLEATAPSGAPGTPATWWAAFDDPLLLRLIDEATQAAASVDSARATLQAARAALALAEADGRPTLSLGGSAQRARSGTSGVTGNSFHVGVDAAWEPDLFGATASTVQAAQADVHTRIAELADARVSVAAEVALDYVALRLAQQRLEIAEANLASQRETLQLTDWRVRAGLASAVDLAQARTSVAQLEAQRPALALSAASYRHALALLTGRAPAALDALLAAPGTPAAATTPGTAPRTRLPQPPATLALAFPADTLRQRADLRAAESALRAAAARIDAADAARLPSLSLSGALGLTALSLGGLDGGALAASLGAALSLPLIDGGAARARIAQQQAVLEQARAAWRSTALTALKDVEDALQALARDRERVTALAEAERAARDAAQLARWRHEGGLIDFQTVLDTQRTRLSAEDSLASARADVVSDHIRLFKALGGGWQPEAPTAALATPAGPTAQAAAAARATTDTPTVSASRTPSALPATALTAGATPLPAAAAPAAGTVTR